MKVKVKVGDMVFLVKQTGPDTEDFADGTTEIFPLKRADISSFLSETALSLIAQAAEEEKERILEIT